MRRLPRSRLRLLWVPQHENDRTESSTTSEAGATKASLDCVVLVVCQPMALAKANDTASKP